MGVRYAGGFRAMRNSRKEVKSSELSNAGGMVNSTKFVGFL